jgi:hypothetical protein
MGVRFHVGPISFGLGSSRRASPDDDVENFILGILLIVVVIALALLPVLGLVAAVAFSRWLKDKGFKLSYLISTASYVLVTASWFFSLFLIAKDAGLDAAARIRPESFNRSEFTQEMAIAEYLNEAPGQIFEMAALAGLYLVLVVGVAAGVFWIAKQLFEIGKTAWDAI